MGHPLVTVPFVVIYILFQTQPFKNALFIASLVIGLIQIPVLIHLFKKLKMKKIESFDVSNRQERKKFYFFLFPLVVLVSLVLYLTKQSVELIYGFLFATILLLMMQIMNYFIKTSLHVAVNFYLGFLLFDLNPILGIFWWAFTVLIAWSRFELNKHTAAEICYGSLIGSSCGIGLQFFI